MNGNAIVMFLVGAIGLWGGFALALTNYLRKLKKDPNASTEG